MSEKVIHIITQPLKSRNQAQPSAPKTQLPPTVQTNETQVKKGAETESEEFLLLDKAKKVCETWKKHNSTLLKAKDFLQKHNSHLTQADRILVENYIQGHESASKECEAEAKSVRTTMTSYMQGKQALLSLLMENLTDSDVLVEKLRKQIRDFENALEDLRFSSAA